MDFPQQLQKCVVFLASRKSDEYHAKGTAFLVALKVPVGHMLYLVTARHVIESIAERSDNQKVYLRINTQGRGAVIEESNSVDWFVNDDGRIDVAVLPVHNLSVDWLAIPTEMFVSRDEMDVSITVGNPLFFPGLFVHHVGNELNVPIVRFGNIAALPKERVQTTRGNLNAILVEARSIGGLSGSPVFTNPGPLRMDQDGKFHLGGKSKGIQLLGLIHGHFGVSDTADAESDGESDAIPFPEYRSVNMGIGIVVPAFEILDTLNQPALIELRDRELKAYAESTEAKE